MALGRCCCTVRQQINFLWNLEKKERHLELLRLWESTWMCTAVHDSRHWKITMINLAILSSHCRYPDPNTTKGALKKNKKKKRMLTAMHISKSRRIVRSSYVIYLFIHFFVSSAKFSSMIFLWTCRWRDWPQKRQNIMKYASKMKERSKDRQRRLHPGYEAQIELHNVFMKLLE